MRWFPNLLSIVIVGILLAGCIRPLVPITNIENESLLLKSKFSLQKIGTEIKAAAVVRRWKIVDLAPDKFRATLNSRNKFILVVEISYTTTAISIRYKDSENLEFDGTDIHWKANKWIRDLQKQIIRRTAKLRPAA